jgi:20S proteasome alpha/beta subunit
VIRFFLLLQVTAVLAQDDIYYNSYNSRGEFPQFEYALKAVEKSPLFIGFQENGKSVSLAFRPRISRLIKKNTTFKRIHKFHNIVACTTGLTPDCRAIIHQLNTEIQAHNYQFGQPPNMEYLSQKLADWMVKDLYPKDRESSDEVVFQRPLATAMVLTTTTTPTNAEKESSSATIHGESNSVDSGFVLISHTGSIHRMKRVILGRVSLTTKKVIQKTIESKSSFLEKLKEILFAVQKEELEGEEEYEACDCCVMDYRDNTNKIYETEAIGNLYSVIENDFSNQIHQKKSVI